MIAGRFRKTLAGFPLVVKRPGGARDALIEVVQFHELALLRVVVVTRAVVNFF